MTNKVKFGNTDNDQNQGTVKTVNSGGGVFFTVLLLGLVGFSAISGKNALDQSRLQVTVAQAPVVLSIDKYDDVSASLAPEGLGVPQELLDITPAAGDELATMDVQERQ